SGTNVHLVVKEHLALTGDRHAASGTADGDVAIALSAKTGEQLRQRCEDLLRFIRSSTETVDLVSMAYTLQVGREPMEERLGFAVDSVGKLAARLEAYIDGAAPIEGAFRGRAKRSSEVVALQGGESASRLLELWVTGRTVDWNALWAGKARPARASLPGYP